MAKAQTRGKTKRSSDSGKNDLLIVDEEAGLIFESEEALHAYFETPLQMLEDEYHALRDESDFSDEEQVSYADLLEDTLDDPDEVWLDAEMWPESPLHIFHRDFDGGRYIAVAYVSKEDEPTFVLFHFPTKDAELMAEYERGTLVYSQLFEQVAPGAMEGDALLDGDELAIGLYLAMLKLRGEKDVPHDDFQKYSVLRESTIEEPDEIWRKNDLDGNTLVCFIKEFSESELGDVTYIAVTLEDPQSQVHALLFSFPTTDSALVDRYRQGENLQAEEVVQENSH